MVNAQGYSNWRAVELAIKDAAKKAAREAGAGVSAATVDAQIRQARYDRFLSRVFAEGEATEWMLKGGLSMLARVPRSRTTKDVDLAARGASDLEEAERQLSALVGVDLGDHLTFRLTRSLPTGAGENQPGLATRRFTYDCLDVDTGAQIDTVTVDVVVGPAPIGTPEYVEPANRLQLKRQLVTHPYRLFPVVDQVADKVCATMSTDYPGGRRSSRVKDLVDLVVLAQTQAVDLGELRVAIATKQTLSGMTPFAAFTIPGTWHRTYPNTAKGVPSAQTYTAAEAANLVARFVDPALATADDSAIWDPEQLAWSATASVPKAYPAP